MSQGYREITQEELEEVLEKHEKWLEGDRRNGKQADLRKTHLHGKDFSRHRLEFAILEEALLDDAILTGADLNIAYAEGASFASARMDNCQLIKTKLQDSDLRSAILDGSLFHGPDTMRDAAFQDQVADITGAKLRDASLKETNLRFVHGFVLEQLSGTDITDTILPDRISDGLKRTLANVEEAGRKAGRVFTTMMALCGFALLTVLITTDVALIANRLTSPLPFVGSSVEVIHFYYLIPCLLGAAYLYFHLYLLRVWELVGKLPAVFQDGVPLHEQLYPWLMLSLVPVQFARLKEFDPQTRRCVSIILGWCAVPLTLGVVWWRGLVLHEWLIVLIPICIMILCGIVGFTAWHRMKQRLGDSSDSGSESSVIKEIRSLFKTLKACITAKSQVYSRTVVLLSGMTIIIICIISCVNVVGWNGWHLINADITQEDVSIRPDGWDGDRTKVRGARLRGAQLQGVDASETFLVNADLWEADLRGAHFSWANLRGAEVTAKNIQGALFIRANLQEAVFSGVNLRGVHFEWADLQEAKLEYSNLDSTNLYRANLRFANLTGVTGWREIASVDNANIYGIIASDSVRTWLRDTLHAVEIESDSVWRADYRW